MGDASQHTFLNKTSQHTFQNQEQTAIWVMQVSILQNQEQTTIWMM